MRFQSCEGFAPNSSLSNDLVLIAFKSGLALSPSQVDRVLPIICPAQCLALRTPCSDCHFSFDFRLFY